MRRLARGCESRNEGLRATSASDEGEFWVLLNVKEYFVAIK